MCAMISNYSKRDRFVFIQTFIRYKVGNGIIKVIASRPNCKKL